MTVGLAFWIGMFFWLIFGLGWGWRVAPDGSNRYMAGNSALMFILMFLLGWGTFGFAIHN
jgi:hypothetical protein